MQYEFARELQRIFEYANLQKIVNLNKTEEEAFSTFIMGVKE